MGIKGRIPNNFVIRNRPKLSDSLQKTTIFLFPVLWSHIYRALSQIFIVFPGQHKISKRSDGNYSSIF